MGKTTKLFAWISGILFIAGVIFKYNHLSGANILLIVSTLSYCAFYLPLWLIEKLNTSSSKFFYVAQFIMLMVLVGSGLFKLMHWNGSLIMFYINIGVFIFLFIPGWIYRIRKQKKYFGDEMHIALLIIFLQGYVFLQLNYAVSQSLLFSYTRTGVQLEKTYSQLKVKSEKLYQSFDLMQNKNDSIYRRAQQLKRMTDETENFIAQIKALLISQADGISLQQADSTSIQHVRNNLSIDVASGIMLGKSNSNGLNGKTLKAKIDTFRDSSINLIYSANKAIIAEGINLSTDDISDELGVKQSWEEANFGSIPLNSALSTLLSLQCEIKNAENQILTDLFNTASLHDKTNLAAQMTEMGLKYESEKKEQQITLMKKDKELFDARMIANEKDLENFKKIILYFSLGIAAFLILLFYVFRSNILRRKLNKELAVKNKQLDESFSELKEAQAILVQSEKMASLGQLTAGVAHEINNPINFVSGSITPLKRDISEIMGLLEVYSSLDSSNYSSKLEEVLKYRDQIDLNFTIEEIKSLINGIEEGSRRTADIVKGLRNFSRLDEEEMKKANINEGIESTLVLLNNKLNQCNIEVGKSLGVIPEIDCYPGQLNQVFMNLFTNAIDAVEHGGKISVTTTSENDSIKISIRDTGKGMTDEVKQKIFDPFFTTKDVGKGTGLGLSISYGIIEKHHGEIEVKSEPGMGTEFIISLPVLSF